jgi:hypothetical protein
VINQITNNKLSGSQHEASTRQAKTWQFSACMCSRRWWGSMLLATCNILCWMILSSSHNNMICTVLRVLRVANKSCHRVAVRTLLVTNNNNQWYTSCSYSNSLLVALLEYRV